MTDPNELRSDIERTRHELGEDVDALADKVSPSKMAGRQADKVKGAFSSMKERVMGSAEDAKDAVASAADRAGHTLEDAPHKAAQAAKGNPLAVGLIAFGVGWLASSLIPASDAEKRAAAQAKVAAAPLIDEVKDVAMESADHLREPAEEAIESVKETATDAVENVKREGADAAGGLKEEARHTTEGNL